MIKDVVIFNTVIIIYGKRQAFGIEKRILVNV